jgi:DNA repair exonuclease SbcCD ATPase subunit
VILLRSHILGFGKLRERIIDFQSGLNLIFAANEGGKSTLQRFLVALLYGQLRSDLKVQRRLDPWVEQYKPWHAREYGGILWCRLTDGREMEIHRSFGKEETRIEIRSSTGEDITRQYEQQRNGEVLFARSHFGMPKELFESVGMIRENRVAEIHGYETIRDRIANLAQSGDEELSIRQSLAKIQEKLDSIGSDRAPTKPYKQALDLVQNLQAERKALEERRAQFQNWIEDRNRIASGISALERELLKAQSALLSARRREMEARIQSLEEIQTELRGLEATIENLGARVDFPADRLEELNQLVGSRESTEKHLREIREEKEAALKQLSLAESQRRDLEAYAPFAAGSDAEKITEWFVSYLSISLQKDGLQKTLNRLSDEAAGMENRLNELSQAFSNPQNDWERIAREAAEDEQMASHNCAGITDRIAIEKANLASIIRRTVGRRTMAVVFLLLTVANAIPYLWELTRMPVRLHLGLGTGFAIVGIVMLLFSLKSANAVRNGKEMVHHLEIELANTREEGGRKRHSLNESIAHSGFQNLEAFLAAAKGCEQDRQRLADLQARSAEAEQQRDRLISQSGEMYQLLKDGLAKVGLPCSPGNLKFQIDLLRANLRRFRDLDSSYSACLQKAESLKSKDAELTSEYNSKCARIRSLLDHAQVESPEQFCEECLRRQKLFELLEKKDSRTREFSRLAGNQTLLQWKDRFKELTETACAEAPAIGEEWQARSGSPEPYLPYLPTIAEAEEQEKRVSSRLAGAREEYARAVERVKQAFQNFRPQYEIEEDLAVAERSFGEMEKNRLALEISLETLEKLSRQQQEVLAPQLNAAVEQRFLRLCAGRYEEVKIDPDFQVWVRENNTGELRPAEHLSRGTQDQLYFSMRFGIMDLVSNAEEPCPGFLDEPFAAYDQVRLREAFDVLAEESGRRQVLLFTCRHDILDLAEKHGANIILLAEEQGDNRLAEQIQASTSEIQN